MQLNYIYLNNNKLNKLSIDKFQTKHYIIEQTVNGTLPI